MEINPLRNKNINNIINKKNSELEKDKNVEKELNLLTNQGDINTSPFIKNLIYNNKDLEKNVADKTKIKVNISNNSRAKKNIFIQNNIIDSKGRNKKLEELHIEEDENISIAQRINKFESRIDNLLSIINDFEVKYIKSPETQRIKEQFSNIINKKIYKNRISNDPLYKSWIKTEYNDDFFFFF